MPLYHIHFKVQRGFSGGSEHTRVVSLEFPIQYESDVQVVQEWAAKQVDAESAMLISWRELVGHQRPAD